MHPYLSVVIPAYNEEARILGTLRDALAFLRGLRRPFEVLVVDDGSRDDTSVLVQAEARQVPELRLLSLGRNRGKGAAVRAGMIAATGDVVLFMDADLATPMTELPKLEAALLAGADVAIGSRALAQSQILVHQQALREWMGKSFNLLVRLLLLGAIEFRDTQCGFKLFTRAAAHALFGAAQVDRFAFDVEVLLLARGAFRVAEVPVAWRHVERSKVSPLRDAPRMALDVLRLRLRLPRPAAIKAGPGPA